MNSKLSFESWYRLVLAVGINLNELQSATKGLLTARALVFNQGAG